jgi:hypothetical protein
LRAVAVSNQLFKFAPLVVGYRQRGCRIEHAPVCGSCNRRGLLRTGP